MKDPYHVTDDHFEVHGGFPAIGVIHDYDLNAPTRDISVGGGAEIRAIIGGDVGYKFSIQNK